MLWSSAFLAAVGGTAVVIGLGLEAVSFGVGVVLRLMFHGLMESTADAKYDFSTFFVSFFSLVAAESPFP